MKHIGAYEVNSSTMFLQPVEYGSKIYTRVYETDGEFLSPFKPLDIIKKSCDYFGVDYESRRKGTRLLTGYTRKTPIVIEAINQIFFFPTASPDSPDCHWVSHEHVEDFRRTAQQQTQVTFQNQKSHNFQVSYTTFQSQLFRTGRLKTKLLQRIEKKSNEKSFYLINRPNSLKASESTREYEDQFDLDPK